MLICGVIGYNDMELISDLFRFTDGTQNLTQFLFLNDYHLLLLAGLRGEKSIQFRSLIGGESFEVLSHLFCD